MRYRIAVPVLAVRSALRELIKVSSLP